MGLTWFGGLLAKVAILVGREQGTPAGVAVQGCSSIRCQHCTENLEFWGMGHPCGTWWALSYLDWLEVMRMCSRDLLRPKRLRNAWLLEPGVDRCTECTGYLPSKNRSLTGSKFEHNPWLIFGWILNYVDTQVTPRKPSFKIKICKKKLSRDISSCTPWRRLTWQI